VFNSIRWRIAIPYILLILAVMLALGLILANFLRQNYLSQLEHELSSNAYLLAEALEAPLSQPPAAQAPAQCPHRSVGPTYISPISSLVLLAYASDFHTV